MSGDYHDYVFDVPNRRFVGDFEAMYRAEDATGFDSWHERDLRPLRKRVALEILSQWNFGRILEIGCGKGTFTHLLKRRNNEVLAVDMSQTAIAKARQSFGDIDFRVMTAEQACDLPGPFDLAVVMGTFAYVEGWKSCLEKLSRTAEWCFLGEYVPPNPIGFVKSLDELTSEFQKWYSIESKVVVDNEHCLIFGRRREP